MFVGRESDLRALEAKYRAAKTVQEREWYRHRIQKIQREYNNKKVAHLRTEMIKAYRKGDAETATAISDELQKESKSNG